MARLGLISDTHGLLRPQAVQALRGSALIIHAGDVGKPEILESLAMLAPLVAVKGNVDKGAWARSLPETAITEPAGVPIYVVHNLRKLRIDPAAAGFRIVVSGHSHKPLSVERNGVLYVNPGAAGPRRFKLPITVARLDLGRQPSPLELTESPDCGQSGSAVQVYPGVALAASSCNKNGRPAIAAGNSVGVKMAISEMSHWTSRFRLLDLLSVAVIVNTPNEAPVGVPAKKPSGDTVIPAGSQPPAMVQR